MPAPTPTPTPVPLGADWSDWPVTLGDWAYRRDGGQTVATYGAGGQPIASLRCDRATRQVTLARSGQGANGFTIRTTSLSRSLPTETRVAPDSPAPQATATLGANDMLLDAMAFSRGRFVIEQRGAPTLVLPPYAEVGRVIEDCRG